MPAPALNLAPPDPTSPTILVVVPEVAVGLEITRALGTRADRAHVLTQGVGSIRRTIERLDPDAIFCHIDMLRDRTDAILDPNAAAISTHPLVVVTPRRREAEALHAVNDGALTSLPLPVDSKRAGRALTRALQRRRLTRTPAGPAAQPPLSPGGSSQRAEQLYAEASRGLYMAWQPLFFGRSGKLWGYEALVRSEAPCCPSAWHVLQLASALDQTADLQEKIRRRVAADLARGGLDGVITVNVTVDDLLRSSLGTRADPLRDLADRVVLEVTEDGPIQSIERVALAVGRLRGCGYRVALDDLGAGSAPLSRLLALRPDIIKLDRLAISDCDSDERKQGYIRSVVAMAHEDGACVVAEGVERAEEARVATALGCDLLQGYLLGRPKRRTWWQRHGARAAPAFGQLAPRADAA